MICVVIPVIITLILLLILIIVLLVALWCIRTKVTSKINHTRNSPAKIQKIDRMTIIDFEEVNVISNAGYVTSESVVKTHAD